MGGESLQKDRIFQGKEGNDNLWGFNGSHMGKPKGYLNATAKMRPGLFGVGGATDQKKKGGKKNDLRTKGVHRKIPGERVEVRTKRL